MVTPNQIAVLGSLLISEDCIPQVLSQVAGEDFTDGDCRLLYLAVQALYRDSKPVDPVTVWERAGKEPRLYDLIARCVKETPTAANVGAYVQLLREERRVADAQALALRILEARTMEPIADLVSKLAALMSERDGVQAVTMATGYVDFFERQKHKPRYITWGLPELDDKMYLEAGDFAIIGGYPSDGKTAWALSAAWHQSQEEKVGFFSLETGSPKLMDRLVARTALISMGKIKRRELSEEDFDTVAAIANRFEKSNLELIPAAHMTAEEILGYSRARGYKIIYIDYVQLIESSPETRRENRTNQLSQISRTLHTGGQRAGITIVALSQLTRPERTKGKRLAPRMSDLRESGQLEQDADTVMLLYRENPDDPESRRVLAVEKNKEGQLGQMYLRFDGDTQTFRRHYNQTPPPKHKEPEASQMSLEELPRDDRDLPPGWR